MPGSATHDISGAITAPVFGWGSYVLGYAATGQVRSAAIVGATVTVAHLVGTFYMSPDLDLDSRIYKRWGGIRWVWLPYKNLVKHRSFLSHSVVGGLFRPLYFTMVLASLYLLLAIIAQVLDNLFMLNYLKLAFVHAFYHIRDNPKDYTLFGASFYLGSASSSWVHCLMDRWWPFKQRRGSG